MTKDELRAENERLGAEIAALRELVTVAGTAMPPAPADPDSERDREQYYWLCRDRLSSAATIARCAMDYAASTNFTPVVHSSAGSLRKIIAEPLPYRVKGDMAAQMAQVSA